MRRKGIIFSIICAVSLMFVFQIQSFAYLDPSVVTYLVQAIAGVVIAGSAIFIVLWRKFRKKVSKTLNIDENKNKTVEEDVVIEDVDLSSKLASLLQNNSYTLTIKVGLNQIYFTVDAVTGCHLMAASAEFNGDLRYINLS